MWKESLSPIVFPSPYRIWLGQGTIMTKQSYSVWLRFPYVYGHPVYWFLPELWSVCEGKKGMHQGKHPLPSPRGRAWPIIHSHWMEKRPEEGDSLFCTPGSRLFCLGLGKVLMFSDYTLVTVLLSGDTMTKATSERKHFIGANLLFHRVCP